MKTKLIFSTETKDTEFWIDLPFVPRTNEWLNVLDILKNEEIENIKQSATCWSGIRGKIESIEYRMLDGTFYAEIVVWCED